MIPTMSPVPIRLNFLKSVVEWIRLLESWINIESPKATALFSNLRIEPLKIKYLSLYLITLSLYQGVVEKKILYIDPI